MTWRSASESHTADACNGLGLAPEPGVVWQTAGVPTLSFPSDEVVGTLDWAGAPSPGGGPVLATGDVEVPHGEEISLTIQRVESVNVLPGEDGALPTAEHRSTCSS
jgi:hypothetical protein